MELCIVCDLIALTRTKHKASAIFQFSMKLAFEAKKYMPFGAPMISQITWAVLDHSYSDITEVSSSPVSHTLLASVRRLLNF
tara:strand:- start:926 stop:1171 length:246 start_codon:yes stop_codon:yes gene_type:complete